MIYLKKKRDVNLCYKKKGFLRGGVLLIEKGQTRDVRQQIYFHFILLRSAKTSACGWFS